MTERKITHRFPRSAALIGLLAMPAAQAGYLDDIGYVELQAALGAETPTGAGIAVTQVEGSVVPVSDSAFPVYAPDPALFPGKTLHFPLESNNPPGLPAPRNGPSGHATAVGQIFYGAGDSMAAGIGDVYAYEVNHWLLTAQNTPAGAAAIPVSRIANHSWVGNGNTAAENSALLRLVDRQVAINETIQVVGMNNGAGYSPLLGSAYNVITVGRTDGSHDQGTDAVPGDAIYGEGRTRPDLVAPQPTTSMATPVVAAAAALLVETAHRAPQLSQGSGVLPGIGPVFNGERSETVKAALLAGADRVTANTSTFANLTDYRGPGHQTSNGLDDRFGAGQINIFSSYAIVAGGEQDSAEDGSTSGSITAAGFDYDGDFGGAAGSNRSATYRFQAGAGLSLSTSLVWNLKVSNDAALETTLYNLDLALFDVSADPSSPVAVSKSAEDNSENLWVRLFDGHTYELRVTTPETTDFSWDYALAWHIGPTATPVPVPAAIWFLASALASFGVLVRRTARKC